MNEHDETNLLVGALEAPTRSLFPAIRAYLKGGQEQQRVRRMADTERHGGQPAEAADKLRQAG